MNRCATLPYRYVMHMWSNGVTPWNTRTDHKHDAMYGGDLAATRERRECTAAELAEIEAEKASWK